MKIKVLILALIISSNILLAQTNSPIYKFSHDIEAELLKDTTPWKYQMAATHYAISGHYRKALETWDKNGTRKPRTSAKDSLLFTSLKTVNAKDYITTQSKNESIVIINEAHHNPKHRTFTKSLLQALYNNGYKYLGLEALFDTMINARKFPVIETGFYTKEPEFGNLISEALKIGFTLFAYEASAGKNGRDREIEQAQNIKRFMDAHPGEKLLIHCGFAHVYENEYKPWEKAMAGRLKEYTGIDPFTINQETYTERGTTELNHPFVNQVAGNEAVVLINKEGNPFNGLSTTAQTDIVVIHPPTKYIDHRPVWLTAGRKPFTVPASRLKQKPALVLAYRAGEYEKNGIPADIIETTGENSHNVLYLSPGTYKLVIQNNQYEIVDNYSIEIK